MGELANCFTCGALFVQQLRTVCPDCQKEEDQQFQIVYTFLRKKFNREATVQEIVEATGVTTDMVYKFSREKRLRTSQFSSLSYPCVRCGALIAWGKLCGSCTKELQSDLSTRKQIGILTDRNRNRQEKKH